MKFIKLYLEYLVSTVEHNKKENVIYLTDENGKLITEHNGKLILQYHYLKAEEKKHKQTIIGKSISSTITL